jgi:non-heme chloroperoxidase
MMGGAKARYDGIKAFSETDFTEDLKVIDVPTLVMHGDDDQIVPSQGGSKVRVTAMCVTEVPPTQHLTADASCERSSPHQI